MPSVKISGAAYEAAMMGNEDLAQELRNGLAFGLDPSDLAADLTGKYNITRKRHTSISLSCAMVCAEASFHAFLTEVTGHYITSTAAAEKFVGERCQIKSLQELNDVGIAQNRWLILKAAYDGWLRT